MQHVAVMQRGSIVEAGHAKKSSTAPSIPTPALFSPRSPVKVRAHPIRTRNGELPRPRNIVFLRCPGPRERTRSVHRQFAQGLEVGSSFAAYVDGEIVVDLAAGIADTRTAKPYTSETITLSFSGTKGFVAMCMAILLDRGKIALDEPVASYWPEFGQHGKDRPPSSRWSPIKPGCRA